MIPAPAADPRMAAFAALNHPDAVRRLPNPQGGLDELAAFSAALLARPDLATPETIGGLVALVVSGETSRIRRIAAAALLSLAAGPLGREIARAVEARLLGDRAPGIQQLFRLYTLLCTGWIENVCPEALCKIAARRKKWRRRLVWYGFARLAAARGAAVAIPGAEPALASLARDVLSTPSPRVLFSQEDEAGVGDELSHASILLDPWLTASPTLTIDVIPKRGFLYTHPRVRVIEPGGASPHYDLIIRFGRRLDASAGRVELILAGRFHLASILHNGRAVRIPHFLRMRSHNGYYEPGWRLLAALGFTTPAGVRRAECVLDVDDATARAEWEALRGDAAKTCLFHPFGGTYPRKGLYPSEYGAARQWIEGLTAQGYRVIVLPTRQPWGTHAAVEKMLEPLPPDVRANVAVPTGRVDDAAMRRFWYFTARADRVVAVEGWLIHVAYALGRPFDAIVLEPWYLGGAGAAMLHWVPLLRTADQRIAAPCDPSIVSLHQAIWPRHLLRAAMLGILHDWRDTRGVEWALDQLQGSRTTRVRQLLQVIRAGLTPEFRNRAEAAALRWIDHPKPRLRAEAARLLLATRTNLSDKFGGAYRSVLGVFIELGLGPLASDDVRSRILAEGDAARLALAIAAKDDEPPPYHDHVRELIAALT